jgi:tetratricopeptide (TPR) repeat protein
MKVRLAVLLVVGLCPVVTLAEEPAYKRLLKGDDAAKVAALEKEIEELWAAAKFAEAQKPATEILALRQRVQGKGHWQTGDAARKLETLRQATKLPAKQQQALAEVSGLLAKAEDLTKRGKYAQAEPLFRKVLAVCEEVLGPKHPDTATSYNELAVNLEAQGRSREAEPLHRKVLAVHEDVLGPKHPDTATSYNNLAYNLGAQGRSREAEPSYRKALAVREEVLGPKHPDTATSYANLAVNLEAQGRPREAEPFKRMALAVYEEVLGPKHPDTARGYNNLAVNLEAQGRSREAEPLFRKALAVREEVLGRKHPETALSYHNLAFNLEAQGRSREAEPLKRNALAVYEEVLGPKHPDTATSYANLAVNLEAQGRAREAEPFYHKALGVHEEALGPKHPNTARGYNNLAVNLEAQGRAREAEPLHRKALAVREEVLGPMHPDTATSYANLAVNLEAQGRLREAEPFYRKALAVREEVLGLKHPDTARGYNNLAVNLQAQGRAREAEPFHGKALCVWEEVLGPKHPDTATSYNNLASNLEAQGRIHDAEQYWRAAVGALEAARLRLAATGLDRASAVRIQPHAGLALCLARMGKDADAWQAAEAGLARGLLDDLAARGISTADPAREKRLRDRAARLEQFDRLLLPLLTREKLTKAEQQQREQLSQQRTAFQEEIAQEAAALSRREVYPLERIRPQIPADAALVFWLDRGVGESGSGHWRSVLRCQGPPAWVRLPGTGPNQAWTDNDNQLPGRLRTALADGAPDWPDLAKRLAAQRLKPLAAHLGVSKDLPAVRRLFVVPVGAMAGVPLDVLPLPGPLTIGYTPSGTVFARQREEHRPLDGSSLLALGDPAFALPNAPPPHPDYGILLMVVPPDSNAFKAGLRSGDVLLRYAGKKLTSVADLKIAEGTRCRWSSGGRAKRSTPSRSDRASWACR